VTGAIFGLSFGNSVWVCAGNTSGISTSSDGDTWTAQAGATVPSAGGIRLMFANGYHWAASANNYWRSTDGVTWAQLVPRQADYGFNPSFVGAGKAFTTSTGVVPATVGWVAQAGTNGMFFTKDFVTWDYGPEISGPVIKAAHTFNCILNDIVFINTGVASTVGTAPYYGYDTGTQFKVPTMPPRNQTGCAIKAYIRAL
jgi:hypothetical protein